MLPADPWSAVTVRQEMVEDGTGKPSCSVPKLQKAMDPYLQIRHMKSQKFTHTFEILLRIFTIIAA